MTERMNLNMEDLEMITGGSWDCDTLTEEERTEVGALIGEANIAMVLGATERYYAAMAKIEEFKANMDAKYGPN